MPQIHIEMHIGQAFAFDGRTTNAHEEVRAEEGMRLMRKRFSSLWALHGDGFAQTTDVVYEIAFLRGLVKVKVVCARVFEGASFLQALVVDGAGRGMWDTVISARCAQTAWRQVTINEICVEATTPRYVEIQSVATGATSENLVLVTLNPTLAAFGTAYENASSMTHANVFGIHGTVLCGRKADQGDEDRQGLEHCIVNEVGLLTERQCRGNGDLPFILSTWRDCGAVVSLTGYR